MQHDTWHKPGATNLRARSAMSQWVETFGASDEITCHETHE